MKRVAVYTVYGRRLGTLEREDGVWLHVKMDNSERTNPTGRFHKKQCRFIKTTPNPVPVGRDFYAAVFEKRMWSGSASPIGQLFEYDPEGLARAKNRIEVAGRTRVNNSWVSPKIPKMHLARVRVEAQLD